MCQWSLFHDSGALEACVICACRDCLAYPTPGMGWSGEMVSGLSPASPVSSVRYSVVCPFLLQGRRHGWAGAGTGEKGGGSRSKVAGAKSQTKPQAQWAVRGLLRIV